MDQLQVFIAIAAGFMLAALFLELMPENIQHFEGGLSSFFRWSLVGMGLVVVFERYGVPRLKFVERFFHSDHQALAHVHTHDETIHASHDHHHHHHNLEEAENCDLSHEHGHLHSHTHMDVIGHGEVCSAIACFMICSFFDGMALSSIQAVDLKLGIVIVIGVVFHLLPEGILSGAMALAGGASLKAASQVMYFIGGAFVLGALIPVVWKGQESIFLAVSCGVLLFVTLVQLVPTALKLKRAPGWIFLGAALFEGSHFLLEWLGVGGH